MGITHTLKIRIARVVYYRKPMYDALGHGAGRPFHAGTAVPVDTWPQVILLIRDDPVMLRCCDHSVRIMASTTRSDAARKSASISPARRGGPSLPSVVGLKQHHPYGRSPDTNDALRRWSTHTNAEFPVGVSQSRLPYLDSSGDALNPVTGANLSPCLSDRNKSGRRCTASNCRARRH